MSTVVLIIIIAGLVFSIARGVYAARISKGDQSLEEIKKLDAAWRLHQGWFNFCGSLVGCLSLVILIQKFSSCVTTECSAAFGAWDCFGCFVAFLGITGYLPLTIHSIIGGLTSFVEKAQALLLKPGG